MLRYTYKGTFNPHYLLLAILIFARPIHAERWKSDITTSQFKHWFPQYGFIFDGAVKENCVEEYENYLTKVKDSDRVDWYGGGVSSAQVLLGVTPTILAVLGASASELSMVSVVAQRPLLSFLLALGSPSVFASRAFEHSDPNELLRDRKGRLRQSHLRRPARRRLVAAAQYAAAPGAVANVAELDWELGIKTVCSFWPDNVIGPILWGLLVIPAHVGGGIVLRLQIRRTSRTTPGAWAAWRGQGRGNG
ncbi:hypothetical protein Daus18300_008739 [Diaporthe australafricana]|uniref:Uncharacterized protein n=1 Tax=Diaporthe australafricana TaxID=127596 RepID=A0ABR3WH81_9PEZI